MIGRSSNWKKIHTKLVDIEAAKTPQRLHPDEGGRGYPEEAGDETRDILEAIVNKEESSEEELGTEEKVSSEKTSNPKIEITPEMEAAEDPAKILEKQEDIMEGTENESAKPAIPGPTYTELAQKLKSLKSQPPTPETSAQISQLRNMMRERLLASAAKYKFSFERVAVELSDERKKEIEEQEKREEEERKRFIPKAPHNIGEAPTGDLLPPSTEPLPPGAMTEEQEKSKGKGVAEWEKQNPAPVKPTHPSVPKEYHTPSGFQEFEDAETQAYEAYHDIFRADEGRNEDFKNRIIELAIEKSKSFGADKTKVLSDPDFVGELSPAIMFEVDYLYRVDPVIKRAIELYKGKQVSKEELNAYVSRYRQAMGDLLQEYAQKIVKNNKEYITTAQPEHSLEGQRPMHSIDKQDLKEMLKDKTKLAKIALTNWKQNFKDEVEQLAMSAQDTAEFEHGTDEPLGTKENNELREKLRQSKSMRASLAGKILNRDIVDVLVGPKGSNMRLTLDDLVDKISQEVSPDEAERFISEMEKFVRGELDNMWHIYYSKAEKAFRGVKEEPEAEEADKSGLNFVKAPEKAPSPKRIKEILPEVFKEGLTMKSAMENLGIADELKTIFTSTGPDQEASYETIEDPKTHERHKRPTEKSMGDQAASTHKKLFTKINALLEKVPEDVLPKQHRGLLAEELIANKSDFMTATKKDKGPNVDMGNKDVVDMFKNW